MSYLLFERMQREGFDVCYINLVHENDQPFLRSLFGCNVGNPRSLANVDTCVLEEPLWRAHVNLSRLITSVKPDLLFGFGFIAARLFQLAMPGLPLVFMTAGSRQLGHLVETGAIRDFIGFKRRVAEGVRFPISAAHPERRAAESADLIIVHSPLVRFAFNHFFPTCTGKIYASDISVADLIYPEVETYACLDLPWGKRDIDVLFIASRWNRPEKNQRLMKKIISRCRGLNLHVVGSMDGPCPGAQQHGVIAVRRVLFELLGRSKTLVCPSALDAAPGILFEASGMGCNVIASRNCGNWQLCNEELLADNNSPQAFLSKIERSLAQPYKDNQDQFRGGYKDLVETLSVM